MERILIVGCPGAGKSTLARSMAEKLGLPLVHLDVLFWLPGWQQREREEFDALLLQELNKPKWIIDGNFSRTLSLRLQYCDTVIFLDFHRLSCVRGVLQRVCTQRGKVRSDMGAGCPERFDFAFLRSVWNFKKNNRAKLLRRMEDCPGATCIILRNRREVKRFLASLEQ